MTIIFKKENSQNLIKAMNCHVETDWPGLEEREPNQRVRSTRINKVNDGVPWQRQENPSQLGCFIRCSNTSQKTQDGGNVVRRQVSGLSE